MASSFNTNKILGYEFAVALAAKKGLIAEVMPLIPAQDGETTIELTQGAFGGPMNTVSANATDVSLSDLFTYKGSFNLEHKVVKHRILKSTWRSQRGMKDAGVGLAQSLQTAIDKCGFDGLAGLFNAAHPRVGTGAGQVGSTKKFLDTGLAYLQGEAGAGTQDNLITSALSETSLNTAIKLMAQYRTDRGNMLHLGLNGGLVLVVSTKNMQLAHELVRSQLSGSDMADNFLRGIVSRVVVWAGFADDDDWFLIDPANCPVAVGWDPNQTEVRYSETTDGLFVELVAETKIGFGVAPYEPGIIGANVA